MYNENKEQRPGNKEPGNKESKEQGQRRPSGPIVNFRYQNNVKQKKMKKSEKIDLVDFTYNQNKFKERSIENQRFDLLELTSELIDYSNKVVKDCKNLENRIDIYRYPKRLDAEINYQTNIYGSLSYSVMQVQKKFERLNSFMEIYLTNKNDEQ